MRTRITKRWHSHLAPLAGELDPDVAEMLSQPARKEDAFVDAVREAGGDDSVQKAAAGLARAHEALVDAFADAAPAARTTVRKAIRELADLPTRALDAAQVDDVQRTNERIRKAAEELRVRNLLAAPSPAPDGSSVTKLETAAAAIRKSDPTLTSEQAVAKALDDDPSLYEPRYLP